MIENQNLAYELMKKIEALLESSKLLVNLIKNEEVKRLSQLVEGMDATLVEFVEISASLKEQEPALNLQEASLSIQKSLALIWMNYDTKNETTKIVKKIKYELIPLIEEMRANFYFWACVYSNQGKMDHYYEQEIHKYYHNVYLEHAQKTGIYPYEISIVVVGYNKCESRVE